MDEKTLGALKITAGAAGLGIAGDMLLRETPWGLNVLIWTVALVAGMVLFCSRGSEVRSRSRLWLLVPILLAAGGFVWRESVVLKSLDAAALVVALGIAAMGCPAGKTPFAGTAVYVRGIARMVVDAVYSSVPLYVRDIEWTQLRQGRKFDWLAPLLRGLAIAVPMVILFGALFMSADAVFQRLVSSAFHVDPEKSGSHLFFIVVCAWLAGGFLRSIATPEPAAAGESKPLFPLGITEIGIALGMLNLLFLCFVIIQIRYLFGGDRLVQVTAHLTYADYSRRGFFELVAVAALMLPVLLHAHTLLSPRTPSNSRIFAALTGVNILLLFVIIGSAVHRMRLYQAAYGLTELRFYTTAFMFWLAVIFVWFAATVLTGRRSRFTIGAMVTGLAAIAALHAVNPDAYIVRANVSRLAQGKTFDASYAAGLSEDAIPELVSALPKLPLDKQTVVADILEQRMPSSIGRDWRSWTWSHSRARSSLRRNEAALRAERETPPAPVQTASVPAGT